MQLLYNLVLLMFNPSISFIHLHYRKSGNRFLERTILINKRIPIIKNYDYYKKVINLIASNQ